MDKQTFYGICALLFFLLINMSYELFYTTDQKYLSGFLLIISHIWYFYSIINLKLEK